MQQAELGAQMHQHKCTPVCRSAHYLSSSERMSHGRLASTPSTKTNLFPCLESTGWQKDLLTSVITISHQSRMSTTAPTDTTLSTLTSKHATNTTGITRGALSKYDSHLVCVPLRSAPGYACSAEDVRYCPMVIMRGEDVGKGVQPAQTARVGSARSHAWVTSNNNKQQHTV